MLTKSTIAILTLTSGLAIGSAAQAKEVNLEQYVSHMMTNTIKATQLELQYNIQEAVLTAGNMFSLDGETQLASNVTITDLPKDESAKKQAE